jgi:hypothetical protein
MCSLIGSVVISIFEGFESFTFAAYFCLLKNTKEKTGKEEQRMLICFFPIAYFDICPDRA